MIHFGSPAGEQQKPTKPQTPMIHFGSHSSVDEEKK